jgi:hypothetical protein
MQYAMLLSNVQDAQNNVRPDDHDCNRVVTETSDTLRARFVALVRSLTRSGKR